jgi:hypothetical protein
MPVADSDRNTQPGRDTLSTTPSTTIGGDVVPDALSVSRDGVQPAANSTDIKTILASVLNPDMVPFLILVSGVTFHDHRIPEQGVERRPP